VANQLRRLARRKSNIGAVITCQESMSALREKQRFIF
jgi:hypothetical protein